MAEFKAFVATVAEAAKQKKLSEDIQLDAVEMVRRSERALGVAIRQGQEAGEIQTQYVGGGPRTDYERNGKTVRVDRGANSTAISPKAFVPGSHELVDTYVMTDHVSDEQFDEAIQCAKEEGNLSRTNVVSKVKELASYRDVQADASAKLVGSAEPYWPVRRSCGRISWVSHR